jgi:acetyl esterase
MSIIHRSQRTDPKPKRLRIEYAFGSTILDAPAPADVQWQDRGIQHRNEGQLSIRVYTPPTPGPHPGIVFFHGGGYVIGNLESHHSLCAQLSKDTGAVVVAVDYRLAPEFPFPTPWNDAEDAWRAVTGNPAAFGISGPIAVGGDSAGANLAIWVGHRAATAPHVIWALYPPTDAGQSYPSNIDFGEGLLLTNQRKCWFRDQTYPNSEDLISPQAQPAKHPCTRADGVVVPEIVAVAGMDVLHDEGELYIAHLEAQSIPVTAVRVASQVHGFASLRRFASCQRAWEATIVPLVHALEDPS